MSITDLADRNQNSASTPHHLLDGLHDCFSRCFNRSSFLFGHDLDREPLLSLPSLAALAMRLAPTGSYYWSGEAAAIGDGWGESTGGRCGLAEAVETVGRGNSLIMLKNAINDPLFGPLFHDIVEQIYDLCGVSLRDDALAARATILIASPGRWTPYHADADCNFLMQVAGCKSFGLFSHTDRSLVPDTEIEQLLAGDVDAIRHKPERQHEATLHDLRPGRGLHVPPFSPHWAKNGSEVSIALSLNFDLRSIQRLKSICKINRHMRRLGLHPKTPGLDPRQDRAKAMAAGMIPSGLLQRLRGGFAGTA